MSTVTGSNFTMYTGDGLRALGCEESCTLTLTSEEIITTTKGSGGFTNREIGVKDWSVQSSGVLSINSSFDGSGSNLDPLEFIAYQLQGKKVVVKLLFTDGTISKWLIGNGIVVSATYAGPAGQYSTYDVLIKADGKLFASDNMISRDSYDGPSTYIYTATGTADGFSAATLDDANVIYFIHRSNTNHTYLTADVQTLALATDLPVGANTVGFHAASGTINFEDALLTGQIVTVCYDVV